MDDVFLKISEIIKADFFCQQAASKLTLQDSSGKPVEIKKKGKIICLEIDKRNENIFPFFNKAVEGLCSIADRILFYFKDESLFVFIIELKTNNHNGAMFQVNASYELAQYITQTVKRLLNYKNLTVEYRGLIFSGRIILKGTTKPTNLQYSVHNGSNLKYKHLPSGKIIELDNFTY